MPRLDFNCDLGEGCGDDAAIIPLLSSASIACGGHAGDEASMRATLRLCRDHGVAAGAHPSYVDREAFGRRELELAPAEIEAQVVAQVERLADVARDEGVRLAHVKPHGALYNRAARDRAVADAIARAVHALDPSLVLFGLAGSELPRAGTALGLSVANEVFAERRYEADGTLTPRAHPEASIDGIDDAVEQVRTMLRDGRVVARTGERIPVQADTLCLHGDRPGAAAFARRLRDTLEAEGIDIVAPGRA